MIEKINDNIWKIANDSNIYYLKEEHMLIDCGNREFIEDIKKDIKELFNLDDIKIVIFTHLHYDHAGCVDLFKNAKFYAHPIEIDNFIKIPKGLVFYDDVINLLENIRLQPLQTLINFEIIPTPGHTAGSICLFYKNKILFSGDTIFRNGVGRTDLPSSNPRDMEFSLAKLKRINYEILCPGHDY